MFFRPFYRTEQFIVIPNDNVIPPEDHGKAFNKDLIREASYDYLDAEPGFNGLCVLIFS